MSFYQIDLLNLLFSKIKKIKFKMEKENTGLKRRENVDQKAPFLKCKTPDRPISSCQQELIGMEKICQ